MVALGSQLMQMNSLSFQLNLKGRVMRKTTKTRTDRPLNTATTAWPAEEVEEEDEG